MLEFNLRDSHNKDGMMSLTMLLFIKPLAAILNHGKILISIMTTNLVSDSGQP
jgi:hypothetical protein